MTLSQYRSSRSWLGAIELGPKLMNLAEELPASEEMGLSLQLRQLMVKLPTTIGADLVMGGDTRKTVGFRLQATLEMIERVYPALDTAGVRADADALVERLMSDEQFAAVPEPEPAPVAAEPEPEPTPAATEPEPLDVPTLEPAETLVLPTEATTVTPVATSAPTETASVPVSTEPTA